MKLVRAIVGVLDRLIAALPPKRRLPPHIETGRKGEELAYFWLRQRGYVMVARNWLSVRRRGEVDLIGWEDGELCFIEVKTRTTRAVKPGRSRLGSRQAV